MRGFVFLFVLIASSIGSKSSELPAIGGMIEALRGDNVRIERANVDLPARLYVQLHIGDTVRVRGQGDVAIIRLNDGKEVIVDATSSPYVVPVSEHRRSVWTNLIGWAGEFFARIDNPRSETETVGMVGRGSGSMVIRSGLLLAEQVFLVHQRERIALAWSGGSPPYEVSLARMQDRSIVTKAEALQDNSTLLMTGRLSLGDYLLSISDSRKEVFKSSVTLVDEDQLPEAFPLEISRKVDFEADVVLRAALLLANDEDGRWRLEAYQRLWGVKENSRASHLLGLLRSGERIGQ